MSRRKYRLRPPTNPAYKTGQVLTFDAAGEAAPPPELVELTPVGPVPVALTPKPDDHHLNGAKPLPPPGEFTPVEPQAQ